MTIETPVGTCAPRNRAALECSTPRRRAGSHAQRVRPLQDIVAPFQHYPAVIQAALLRVESHPSLRLLTRATLATLKALITRANARDGLAAISAKVERLARETEYNEKTIRRSLQALVEEGLIGMSERRDEEGVYRCRDYQLSKDLCRMLALPIPGEKGQGTEMSDGHIYDLSFKKDLREIQEEKPEPRNPIQLPAAVADLPAATGIKDTGICKLLGLANRAGHQLADVYAIASPHLSKMLGNPGRIFKYLLAMLKAQPGYYAAKAAQLQRIAAEQGRRDLATQTDGKHFLHANGALVKILNGCAEVLRHGQVQFVPGPDMAAIYADIAAGNLVEQTESQVEQHRLRESRWRQGGDFSLGQLVAQAKAAPGAAVLAESKVEGERAPVLSAAFSDAMLAARAILASGRTKRGGEGAAQAIPAA